MLFRSEYKRSREVADGKTGPEHHKLLLAMIAIYCLCLAKLFYLLILPIIGIALLLIQYRKPENIISHVHAELRNNLKPYLLYFCLPVVILFASVFIANYCRFGSPFNTGYRQWAKETDLFSGNLLEGIGGYLFNLQYSVFICFPMLLFSLAVLRRFARKHLFDLGLCYAVFLIFMISGAKFVHW